MLFAENPMGLRLLPLSSLFQVHQEYSVQMYSEKKNIRNGLHFATIHINSIFSFCLKVVIYPVDSCLFL